MGASHEYGRNEGEIKGSWRQEYSRNKGEVKGPWMQDNRRNEGDVPPARHTPSCGSDQLLQGWSNVFIILFKPPPRLFTL
jgi:hypothetical protein